MAKQSTEEKPKQSTVGKPKQSTVGKPKQSTEEKPKQSTVEKPQQSTVGKPKQSTEEKPKQSTEEKPKQSKEVITKCLWCTRNPPSRTSSTECYESLCRECIIGYIGRQVSKKKAIIRCPMYAECVDGHMYDASSWRKHIPKTVFDDWVDNLYRSATLKTGRCNCSNPACMQLVVKECVALAENNRQRGGFDLGHSPSPNTQSQVKVSDREAGAALAFLGGFLALLGGILYVCAPES